VEHERQLREFLVRSTSELGVELTDEKIAQFMLYLEQLRQWDKITNLTSIRDPHEIVSKHFVDSLTALAATNFPSNAVVIDVGSGAGFPSLPLKIARSDLQLILVEPTKKKCSFLNLVIGLLRLMDVSIFAGTLQQYTAQTDYIHGDVMVVRALRFSEIERQARTALNKMGKTVLYRAGEMGISSAPSGFVVQSEKSFALPMNHGRRVISVLTKSIDAAQ
jgi:16S rRNA (guanine527-N7)-methyltransferase